MIPSGVRVWIAMGHTDMRKGMPGLALLVQQGLKRDPHLCVGRDYVAAASTATLLCAFAALGRHINHMLSSNWSTASFALNRAGCLPEIAAASSPRRIISTSAAA